MRRYEFLDPALEEYEDAISYYADARPGLGESFARDVDEVLSSIVEFPNLGMRIADTPLELNVRRRLVHIFGVEIDYLADGDLILVLAVFHTKRRPGYWQDRLRSL